MTDIKARLNKAADQLHDKALVAATQGRVIVWCLTPDDAEKLSRWLRTESRCLYGDEDHAPCATEDCTALAALEFAKGILPKEETAPVQRPEPKVGDKVYGRTSEHSIVRFDEDHGTQLSSGVWVCASHLEPLAPNAWKLTEGRTP